jgi:hypothetical protein
MIRQLIKIANRLDAAGYYDLASEIDMLLKTASIESDLTRALKDKDPNAAKRVLLDAAHASRDTSAAQELGLDDNTFRELYDAIGSANLNRARDIWGIGKEEDLTDTSKYNPITGKPWTSGPVETSAQDTTLRKYLQDLKTDLERKGARRIMFSSRGEDNMLVIEYRMVDEFDAEDFDDTFRSFNIFDEVLGNILVEGGQISDGPDVGLYLEAEHETPGKSLFDYTKDIFDVED